MSKLTKIKLILLIKWDALVVVFVSLVYGMQLIAMPKLLDSYAAYEVISYLTKSRIFGYAFIILSLVKLFSIYKNNIRLKSISISLIGGLWLFFLSGFALSPVYNSLWVLPLAMSLLCLGISVKELVK